LYDIISPVLQRYVDHSVGAPLSQLLSSTRGGS
jgi:hypothetical protein